MRSSCVDASCVAAGIQCFRPGLMQCAPGISSCATSGGQSTVDAQATLYDYTKQSSCRAVHFAVCKSLTASSECSIVDLEGTIHCTLLIAGVASDVSRLHTLVYQIALGKFCALHLRSIGQEVKKIRRSRRQQATVHANAKSVMAMPCNTYPLSW